MLALKRKYQRTANKYYFLILTLDLPKLFNNFSFFAKLNLVLPDEFIEAPVAVAKALLMKSNLENGIMVEIAQAEIIKSMKVEAAQTTEKDDKSHGTINDDKKVEA